MKIPDTPFRLFLSGGGRILGAAPIEGEIRQDFLFNHVDEGNRVMVVAVTEKPCTMAGWEEIIRLAGTWQNAAEMAISAYGGIPWLGMSMCDGERVVMPFLVGEIAEA